MTTSTMKNTKPRRRTGLMVLIGLVVATATAGAFYGPDLMGRRDTSTDVPIATVRRGSLLISVTESGTIQAREKEILKNELEGRAQIIYLAEEGTFVNKGDLVVELDSSAIQEEAIEREIKVQNAEAAAIGAKEELEVTKSQANSDVAEAELAYRFAKEDLQNYQDGEFPRELLQAESKITLADEKLKNANSTLQWSEKLFEEKYLSQTDLDKDRLAAHSAELDHQLAVADLDLLKKYTYRRRVDELESAVEQAEMSLERVKRKAKASIIQSEADDRAKAAEFERQKDQHARLVDQISKARLTAPASGMVVHATTGKGNWRGNEEPLKEGKEVREREELIHIPVADSMMAKVNIRESTLDKVSLGQKVRVTVDALPGRVFTGTVARIAPLPDAQSVFMNPDLKLYPAEVHLDGSLDEIRTGMGCRAEILVDILEDALYLPIQTVVRVGDQTRVYVQENNAFVPRDVEIGLDNRQMVHIKKGLQEGDVVRLDPPLDAGATSLESRIGAGDFGVGEGTAIPGDRGANAGRPPSAFSDGDPGGGPDSGDGMGSGGGRGKRSRGGGGRPDPEAMNAMKQKFEGMSDEEKAEAMKRFGRGGRGGSSDGE